VTEAAADIRVRVVEVVDEAPDPVDDPAELTPAIDAATTGEVLVQLRRTTPRVTVGSGLARRPGIVDAVRALPGSPLVTTTTAGGTFVVGGPGWLAFSAVGRAPREGPLPLDWMCDALAAWFGARLGAAGLPGVQRGAVEGAWCPGFSDLNVEGRKLVGIGFRLTRERVLARGMIAVTRLEHDQLELLRGCHALIGKEVRREACTSLEELAGGGGWDVERAVGVLRGTS
jgi:hypothetical protein